MRISTGVTVNVSANTERWLSELRAGRTFGGTGLVAALAANVSIVQLFNPVGSLVTVIVKLITVNIQVQVSGGVTLYNTALTTLVGNGANLLNGGANSVAEVRTIQTGGALGTFIASYDLIANTPIVFGGDWLVELGAGEGVTFQPGAVNFASRASFLWMEI